MIPEETEHQCHLEREPIGPRLSRAVCACSWRTAAHNSQHTDWTIDKWSDGLECWYDHPLSPTLFIRAVVYQGTGGGGFGMSDATPQVPRSSGTRFCRRCLRPAMTRSFWRAPCWTFRRRGTVSLSMTGGIAPARVAVTFEHPNSQPRTSALPLLSARPCFQITLWPISRLVTATLSAVPTV